MSRPGPQSSTSGSWTGRFSAPPLPNLSNPTGLRSALLGYLAEVEAALRDRLALAGESSESGSGSGVGNGSGSGNGTGNGDDSGPSDASMSGYESDAAYSSALDSTSTELQQQQQLRQRQRNMPSSSPSSSSNPITSTTNGIGLEHTNTTLLRHLSTLREDVVAYLPSVPTPPSKEWLRSLPYKLSIFDLGLFPSPTTFSSPNPNGNDAFEHENQYQQYENGESGEEDRMGAVHGARQKVIELVHALLPSEEWAGWERLGWEDQLGEPLARSVSGSAVQDCAGRGDDDEDDDEEEPEYLFPNRTPASARALASRRRAVRSKSVGSAGMAWSRASLPTRLARANTAPMLKSVPLPIDDENDDEQEENEEDEDEGDEPDVKDIMDSPDLLDTKLTPLVAPSSLGPTVTQALLKSDDGRVLLEFEDLPFVWRNNEHIISGYRFIPLHASTGPIPLIKSAFAMHNETVNIHSHFIPTLIILLGIPAIAYASPLPDAHWLDTTALILYFIAAVSCLISSAGWHVLSGCASRKWFEWGACVDYIGISWLIAASFGTVVYNAFHCKPKTVVFYCTTNFLCGALGSYLPFQKWFNERKNKNWRIGFFLFLCFAMVTPMAQTFYEHGWQKGSAFVAPFGLSIITYVIGLLFYAFHFPECISPGKFDYWGCSHQIWHVAIVLAIILHYRAVLVAHDARLEYSCAAPDAGRSVGEELEWVLKEVWAGLRG